MFLKRETLFKKKKINQSVIDWKIVVKILKLPKILKICNQSVSLFVWLYYVIKFLCKFKYKSNSNDWESFFFFAKLMKKNID